jgi:hypothetical protein
MTYAKAQFYACIFIGFIMWPSMILAIYFVAGHSNPVLYWVISAILAVFYYILIFQDLRGAYRLYKREKES